MGHESVFGVLNGGGVVGGGGSAAADPRDRPANTAPDANAAPALCHLIEEAEYSMTSSEGESRGLQHGVVSSIGYEKAPGPTTGSDAFSVKIESQRENSRARLTSWIALVT